MFVLLGLGSGRQLRGKPPGPIVAGGSPAGWSGLEPPDQLRGFAPPPRDGFAFVTVDWLCDPLSTGPRCHLNDMAGMQGDIRPPPPRPPPPPLHPPPPPPPMALGLA